MAGRYGWIILVMFLIGMIEIPLAQAFIIERPVKGQTVVAGEPYDVWVRLVPGEVCDSVGPGLSFNAKTGRYEGENTIDPEELGGVSEQIPLLVLGEGDLCRDAKVTINVVLPSTTTLQKIDAAIGGQKSTVLSAYSNPQGERINRSSTEYLSTSGFYSDGVKRYLAKDPNNVYSSSNEKVAIVEAGDRSNPALVTAVGPGDATITVQNGPHRDSVRVTVIEKRCPTEAIKPDGTLNIFKCR